MLWPTRWKRAPGSPIACGQPLEPQREAARRLDEVAPPVVGVDRVAQARAPTPRLVAGRVEEVEEVGVLGEAEQRAAARCRCRSGSRVRARRARPRTAAVRGSVRSWWPSVLPRLSQATLPSGRSSWLPSSPGTKTTIGASRPRGSARTMRRSSRSLAARGRAQAGGAERQARRGTAKRPPERPRASSRLLATSHRASGLYPGGRLPRRARADSIGRSALAPMRSPGRAGRKGNETNMTRKSAGALLLGVAAAAPGCKKEEARRRPTAGEPRPPRTRRRSTPSAR